MTNSPTSHRTIPAEALGLTTQWATTRDFRHGYLAAQGTIAMNRIAAFDGPPGTGKTTCARYIAQISARPTALITMPHRPAPLDLLRHIRRTLAAEADTGGSRYQLQNELRQRLGDWQGVLLIDELQNSQENALQELVYLYEETHRAFALIVIGTGVLQAAARHPQMLSRIQASVTFQTLTGPDLLTTVQQLDPRLKRTQTSLLARHDHTACRGVLRRWVQTVEWLNTLEIHTPPTADDLAQIRQVMPPT